MKTFLMIRFVARNCLCLLMLSWGAVVAGAAPTVSILSLPRQVLVPGESTTLSVSAIGTGALSYAWTHNGRPVSGASSSLLPLTNVTYRDSGYYFALVTDATGTQRSAALFVTVAPAITEVRAWGNYSAAQMEVPAGLNDVIALAAAESNVLALRRDGTVIAWGAPTPSDLRRTPAWSEVVAVASTDNMTYALTSGGRCNTHGPSLDDFGRSKVEYLSDVVALAAASSYTLALLSDGTVVGSGYKFPGYIYPYGDQNLVVEAGLGNVAIAAGGRHALALKADGTVVVWGSNTFGQTDLPIGIANVTAIAAGLYHSLALKTDGTVIAWGRNDSGQTDVPPGLGNVVGISAGSAHSLAVKADGTVVAWGSDSNGQASPPSDLSDVFAVSAGYYSSFALRDLSNQGPPVISNQPSSVMETVHSPAIFSAMVAGAQPIMYQWRKDGVNILGATSASYRISNVNASDAGSYSVVAINSEGSATSNPAVLSVLPPPGDFNGNDQPDLLWQNLNSRESVVWLMNGATVAGYQQVTPPGFYRQIEIVGVADLTGDGRLDLLVQDAGRLGLWAMNEEGQWLMANGEPADYQFLTWVGWKWYVAGVADFNGDSHPDIIWENTRTGEHAIWLCNGTALTTWIPLGTVGIQWSVAGVGDFNGDNKPDLVWQNSLTGERKVWLMNDTIKSSEVSLGFVALAWSIGAVADYNSDGSPDIFWQNTLTGEHAIWLMNGTALIDYVSLPVTTLDWVVGRIPLRPAAADFSLDGKSDLVWQNISTGERKVWHMNGTAMASEVSLGTVGLPWQIAGTGDMDSNAECDILWQNTITGERAIWLMSGTTLSGYVSLGTVPLDWQMTGAGDFNNDNNTDIVWQNTSTGERGIWLMAGTTLSGWASLGNVSTSWQIAGVADFNRDDHPDLLWQNTNTGERKVWLMSGTTMGSEVSLGAVAFDWQIVGAGDYNLDGSTDIVWQNTSTGERGIRLMNGTALSGYIDLGVQPLSWQIAN